MSSGKNPFKILKKIKRINFSFFFSFFLCLNVFSFLVGKKSESPSSFQLTTTASITNATSSLVNNQSSSSVVANSSQNQNSNQSQNSSKSANPTSKTSPPKLSPLSPVGSSLSPPTYPAVLGRGATLPQKSKVPPPVPPRGSPRPKRDLPPNRGNFIFAHGSFPSFTDLTVNWV